MLPQMVALVITGAIVTAWGYYVSRLVQIYDFSGSLILELQVPYIIAGELICIVGLALLTRLSTSINVLSWASALVVTGLGMGMAMQLPYTAVQCTLELVQFIRLGVSYTDA